MFKLICYFCMYFVCTLAISGEHRAKKFNAQDSITITGMYIICFSNASEIVRYFYCLHFRREHLLGFKLSKSPRIFQNSIHNRSLMTKTFKTDWNCNESRRYSWYNNYVFTNSCTLARVLQRLKALTSCTRIRITPWNRFGWYFGIRASMRSMTMRRLHISIHNCTWYWYMCKCPLF